MIGRPTSIGFANLAGQLGRYGLFGLSVNAALYVLYLILTAIGIPPLVATSVIFAAGVPVSFGVHSRYTFRKCNVSLGAKFAFTASYVIGYVTQIGVLAALYRGVGLPHQIAQLVAMGLVALVLFLTQKHWIFRA